MKVRLEVKAPIRAGGREQRINKLEFVRLGGSIHAINPRKLASLLLEKSGRALGDWNTEVLTKGQRADLTKFLESHELLDRESVEKISRYSAPCEHRNMNEFLPHARDGRGRLFIPGTAIKGAIRGAVMWKLVDEGAANEYVRRTRKGKDGFARELAERTLQNYPLPEGGGTAAHRDLLRCVKASDGYGELESRVEKVVIQTYSRDGERRTAVRGATPIDVECLTPGSWIEFDLKVDKHILRDFQSGGKYIPFENEASLLEGVSEFYEEAWNFDRRYYGVEKEDAPEEAAPSGPPSFEEWVTRKYGEMSGKKRRRYRGEYKETFDLFETDETGAERKSPAQKVGGSGGSGGSGVSDGEVKVGKVRDFYSASSPGFRLGWGSGLMSATVDMRLDEENMGKVLNKISSKHHPEVRPMDGPKSRKLVESEGSPRWPMGWASLEVVE